jgi:hypothetical protein
MSDRIALDDRTAVIDQTTALVNLIRFALADDRNLLIDLAGLQ